MNHPQSRDCSFYTNIAAGTLVVLMSACGSSSSDPVSGDVTVNETVVFRVKEINAYKDFGQVLDTRTVTNYNGAGMAIRDDNYRAGESTFYAQSYYIYNENGKLIRFETDNNLDGVVDRVRSIEYDVDDNVIRSIVDSNNDGAGEIASDFEYDELNNLIKINYDLNNDGNIQAIGLIEYDSFGRLLSVLYDENLDGLTNNRLSFRYSDSGKLLSREYDEEDDGVIESRWLFEFEEGNCSDSHLILLAKNFCFEAASN